MLVIMSRYLLSVGHFSLYQARNVKQFIIYFPFHVNPSPSITFSLQVSFHIFQDFMGSFSQSFFNVDIVGMGEIRTLKPDTILGNNSIILEKRVSFTISMIDFETK